MKTQLKHHEECRFIPWTEVFQDKFDVEEHGLSADWAKDHGIMKCHEDCPSLQEAITLGKEIAKKHGW